MSLCLSFSSMLLLSLTNLYLWSRPSYFFMKFTYDSGKFFGSYSGPLKMFD